MRRASQLLPISFRKARTRRALAPTSLKPTRDFDLTSRREPASLARTRTTTSSLKPKKALVSVASRRPSAGTKASICQPRRCAARCAACSAAAGASQALVEPVEAVLDALEALRDRPHATGEALDVGGRGDVQRPHRHLLGLGRLLLRVERAREGAVEQRVLEHVLGELADRILTLAGDPLLQAFRGGLVGHRASLRSLVEAAPL